MKTKLILFLTVICVMIMPIVAFGSTGTISADEEAFEIAPVEGEGLICNDSEIKDSGQTRYIMSFSVSFEKISSTKAMAVVRAKSDELGISSTVILQKKNTSTGKYANVSGATAFKSVEAREIVHSPKFGITSTGKYRIKVVVNDGKDIQQDYVYLN